MATRNKKSGGDVVLGGRHLVGFFALLVVMLAVAFTLGYLLGRDQYHTQLRAAASTVPAASDLPANSAKSASSPGLVNAADRSPASKKNSPAHPPAPPPTDWDFYHSGEPAKPAERLAPQPNALPNTPVQPNRAPHDTVPVANHPILPAAAKPRSTTSAATPSAGSKFIPHGSVVLQVAAVVRQADALSLAQALQKKKFPAFVVPPDTDRYYRIQVGPYRNAQSASAAQQQLEKQGFKSIIKR